MNWFADIFECWLFWLTCGAFVCCVILFVLDWFTMGVGLFLNVGIVVFVCFGVSCVDVGFWIV